MKKAVIFLFLFSVSMFAQQKGTASVEKSVFNIQTGFGLWVNNESKSSNDVTFRYELGLHGTVLNNNDEKTTALVPGISIEPRWYYNLGKRFKKGKDISNNSANYWSIKTLFLSDSFIMSNNPATLDGNQLNITLNWGFKRNFSEHWNYELGAGYGFNVLYKKDSSSSDAFYKHNKISLMIRLGYKL